MGNQPIVQRSVQLRQYKNMILTNQDRVKKSGQEQNINIYISMYKNISGYIRILTCHQTRKIESCAHVNYTAC